MNLSLSVRVAESFSNKREVRIQLPELARIASAAGYDALCLRASMVGIEDSAEKVSAVTETLEQNGLSVSMITGDFAVPENGDEGPRCLRNITPYLDLAESVGADLIRICMKTDEDIAWAARASAEAGERSIRLAHQSHTKSLFETVSGSKSTVERVDDKNFGIIYEPANLALCGEDYGRDTLETFHPFLFNVYLQNHIPEEGGPQPMTTWVRGLVESRLYPLDSGKGIDFGSVFAGLKAIKYDGYITLHHAFDGDLEPEEAAARSARFLRNLM
jgi:sugar phosphate isomerase/epimerase